MKVSEAWLREWVNPALTGQQLAAQLTMAGLEVDALNPVAGVFSHVVVAHVRKTAPHPEADKLTLCEVDAGTDSPLKIVCGATNVRAGLKVALALIGAHLPGDIIIKESMLRGQLSQGMLCSVTELGLDDRSEGILELPHDAPIGTDLRDYLDLNDQVFDIDLTPNRADCFSILGVAREVAALNQLPLQELPTKKITPESDASLKVHLQEPVACPQYCGRVIRGINPDATTPLWMKERLRRGGIRVLHPVVDVTNYVMLELGQPLHAFDLKSIQGDIHVRFGHADETLVLLDGQEVTLDQQVLVIADDVSPLSLAGIMGGEASAVQADTTDIFLESAFFNPLVVAGVARRYGLCSDSSQRFERGVDPSLQSIALERATDLLQSIVGGCVGPLQVMTQPDLLPAKIEVQFNPNKVKQLTGLDIPATQMALMLNGLGLMVDKSKPVWTVAVPPHRFDIALDVDLVEEIIRLYGYDNIVGTPVVTDMKASPINPLLRLSTTIGSFLSGRGYRETISYSFVDPEFQNALYPDAQTFNLLNPISSELSQMRAGLWPGLLASMVYNIHRQQTAIQFFESGVVFDAADAQMQERACVAGLITGVQGGLNWSESAQTFDFYDMKGDLQALFAVLQIPNVRFVAAPHTALHPGQSARILIGDEEAGWMGVLHPRLLDALDLKTEVILFELSLTALSRQHLVHYQPISKYPQIRRDLSLLVNVDVPVDQIEQAVREVVRSDVLKAFDVFDVYMGESIPIGKKSLAIALTLQDDKRTLIDTEIHAMIASILKKLEDDLAIVLREMAPTPD